eukprot:gene3642-4159_t
MSDAKSCGAVNRISSALSFFTASASGFLALGTVALHALIITSIIRDRRKKFQHFFYKLLLNISIADMLCGLLTDPYSAAFHAIEGVEQRLINIKALHILVFLLGSVSLATLIVLCVDRILSILRPLTYRKGVQGTGSWAILVATWAVSGMQITAYFDLGYIRYLIVFASVNIAGAMIGMILTSVVYHFNIVRTRTRAVGTAMRGRAMSNDATTTTTESGGPGQRARRSLSKQTKRERSATTTFIIMSLVIVASYLPTCLATGYMNSCTNCNCTLVHSGRDIAFLSILAGPFARAINFLVCLKPLRRGWRIGNNNAEFSSSY